MGRIIPPRRAGCQGMGRASARARRVGAPSQAMLVKYATLHDGGQVRALVLEQLEVVERVAVHQKEVGEGPRGNHPELALLAEQSRRNRGCRLDDLEGLHHLTADQELAALLVLQLSEEIAAVCDGHTGPLADLEGAIAVLEHDV